MSEARTSSATRSRSHRRRRGCCQSPPAAPSCRNNHRTRAGPRPTALSNPTSRTRCSIPSLKNRPRAERRHDDEEAEVDDAHRSPWRRVRASRPCWRTSITATPRASGSAAAQKPLRCIRRVRPSATDRLPVSRESTSSDPYRVCHNGCPASSETNAFGVVRYRSVLLIHLADAAQSTKWRIPVVERRRVRSQGRSAPCSDRHARSARRPTPSSSSSW